MEARSITQVRIYRLILNPMAGRCEDGTIVAISGDYNRLVSWYEEQKAPEPYRDADGWYRTFTEGSPLHWYNPANTLDLNCPDHWVHGITDEWVNEDVWMNIRRSGMYHIVEED